jgi:ATP-binding protein involved in chromosome partitioning
VLGIIENMSTFLCPQCGHESHVFGSGGGERIAAQCHAPLLGQLPLHMDIREQADGGMPTVARDPDGDIARIYRDAARHMAARLWQLAGTSASEGAVEISMTDD